MKKSAVSQEAKSYFLPVLLGSNRLSHKICRQIFRRYRISSLVLDTKRSWRDLADITSRFIPLCSNDPRLVCHQLRELASTQTYILPLLIATESEYERLLKDFSKELEPGFIICRADEIFTSSPLADIK